MTEHGQRVDLPKGTRIVRVTGEKSTYMLGDDDRAPEEGTMRDTLMMSASDGVLPPLLKAGWRVTFILRDAAEGTYYFFVSPPEG